MAFGRGVGGTAVGSASVGVLTDITREKPGLWFCCIVAGPVASTWSRESSNLQAINSSYFWYVTHVRAHALDLGLLIFSLLALISHFPRDGDCDREK